MTSAAKRLVLETLGWVVLVAGILALFLPGPGLLLTFAGLAILSTQYTWARRLTDPVRVKAWQAAVEGVETPLRVALSTLGALLVGAVGALWVWSPPAPSWWHLNPEWWLFGGPAIGWTLIGSSVLALGLVVFCLVRFRGHPERVERVHRMQEEYRERVAVRRRAHRRLNRTTGRKDRFWHGHL